MSAMTYHVLFLDISIDVLCLQAGLFIKIIFTFS